MTDIKLNFSQSKLKLRSKTYSALQAILPFSLRNKQLIINIHLINENKIQKLNSQFCQQNRPTDVLTFPLNTAQNLPNQIPVELGDIFICRSLALRKNHSLHFLIIHGFLHLLGFDHQTEEEEEVWQHREKRVFDLVGLNFPD